MKKIGSEKYKEDLKAALASIIQHKTSTPPVVPAPKVEVKPEPKPEVKSEPVKKEVPEEVLKKMLEV